MREKDKIRLTDRQLADLIISVPSIYADGTAWGRFKTHLMLVDHCNDKLDLSELMAECDEIDKDMRNMYSRYLAFKTKIVKLKNNLNPPCQTAKFYAEETGDCEDCEVK